MRERERGELLPVKPVSVKSDSFDMSLSNRVNDKCGPLNTGGVSDLLSPGISDSSFCPVLPVSKANSFTNCGLSAYICFMSARCLTESVFRLSPFRPRMTVPDSADAAYWAATLVVPTESLDAVLA